MMIEEEGCDLYSAKHRSLVAELLLEFCSVDRASHYTCIFQLIF